MDGLNKLRELVRDLKSDGSGGLEDLGLDGELTVKVYDEDDELKEKVKENL